MWSNLGILQVSPCNAWFFTNDRPNDFLMMTADQDQRIHIGTQPKTVSALTITKDVVQINRPVRTVDRSIDINGITLSNYAIHFNNAVAGIEYQPASGNLSVIQSHSDALRFMNMRGVVIGKTNPFANPVGDNNIIADTLNQTSLKNMEVQTRLNVLGSLVNTASSNIALGASLIPTLDRTFHLGASNNRFQDLYVSRTMSSYDSNVTQKIIANTTDTSFLYGTVQSLDFTYKITDSNVAGSTVRVYGQASYGEKSMYVSVGDIIPTNPFAATIRFDSAIPHPLNTMTAFQVGGSGGRIGESTETVGFVAKYTTLGTIQWAFQIVCDAGTATSGTGTGVRSVALHPLTGEIFVVGYYKNAFNLAFYDALSTVTPWLVRNIPDASFENRKSGLYLAKFSVEGKGLWVALINNTIASPSILAIGSTLQRVGLAVSHVGRVFITGTYDNGSVKVTHGLARDTVATSATLTFNTWTTFLPLISTLEQIETAGFVLAFDGNTGQGQWQSRIDSTNNEKLFRVVADRDGNVIVGGESDPGSLRVTYNAANNIESTVSIGSSTYSKVAFFVKYSANGQSVSLLNRVFCDGILSVDTDANRNVYLAGYYGLDDTVVYNAQSQFITSIADGGVQITSVGPTGQASAHNIFVAKYQPTGLLEWVRTIRGLAEGPASYPADMVVDRVRNNVYIAGIYVQPTPLSIDSTVVSTSAITAGYRALFLTSLTTNGAVRFTSLAHPFTSLFTPTLYVDDQMSVYLSALYQSSSLAPAVFYDQTGTPYETSPNSIPLTTLSGTLVAKYVQRFIYRLMSNLTPAQAGFVKTLHNSGEDTVYVYIVSNNELNVLMVEELRPNASMSFVWHDQQWKRMGLPGNDAIFQYQDIFAKSIQVVDITSNNIMLSAISSEGDLQCRTGTVTNGQLHIYGPRTVTEQLGGEAIFKVEPDAVTLGSIPLLPSVPENQYPLSNLTLGLPRRRFRDAFTHRTFKGYESNTNDTRITASNTLSFVSPSTNGQIYILPSDLSELDNGFEKTIFNTGSNYGVLHVTQSNDSNVVLNRYLIPAGTELSAQSTSLVWYNQKWHVQSRDIINNQDVFIKSLTLRDPDSNLVTFQTLSNAIWLKRDVVFAGDQHQPTFSNVYMLTQESNLATRHSSLVLHGGYLSNASNASMVFPSEYRRLLTIEDSNIIVPSIISSSVRTSNLYYPDTLTLSARGSESNPHTIRTRHNLVVSTSNTMEFNIWSPQAGSAQFVMGLQGTTGYVGIGTQIPTHGLHLHNKPDIHLTNDETGPLSNDGFLQSLTGRNVTLINQETHAGFMAFGTSNSERMRIHHDGHVQIHRDTTSNTRFQMTHQSVTSNLQRGFEIAYGNGLASACNYTLGTSTTVRSDSNVALLWNYESLGEIHFGTSNTSRMHIAADGDVYLNQGLHVKGGFLRDSIIPNTMTYTDIGPLTFQQAYSTAPNDAFVSTYVRLLTIPTASYQSFEIQAYFFGPQHQVSIKLFGMMNDRNISTGTMRPYFNSEITQATSYPLTPEPNMLVRRSDTNLGEVSVWAILPPTTTPNGLFYIKSTYKEGIRLQLQATDPDSGTDMHNVLLQFSTKFVGATRSFYVGGSLFAQNKYFSIPHPIPEKAALGEQLKHTTVEAPTRGETMYRYKVHVRDAPATVRIELPDYWGWLNDTPQVWVSPANSEAASGEKGAWGEVECQPTPENAKAAVLAVHAFASGTYNVLLMGTRCDPDAPTLPL